MNALPQPKEKMSPETADIIKTVEETTALIDTLMHPGAETIKSLVLARTVQAIGEIAFLR